MCRSSHSTPGICPCTDAKNYHGHPHPAPIYGDCPLPSNYPGSESSTMGKNQKGLGKHLRALGMKTLLELSLPENRSSTGFKASPTYSPSLENQTALGWAAKWVCLQGWTLLVSLYQASESTIQPKKRSPAVGFPTTKHEGIPSPKKGGAAQISPPFEAKLRPRLPRRLR